jgi:thiamine biosynthesis protein ThiS
MKVQLNGQEKHIDGNPSLFDLISQFNQTQCRKVAEINGQIIKNPRWNEIRINDGDVIELVGFVGGG